VGEPDGKRPLRRPSSVWKDNIKIECQKLKCECVYWIDDEQQDSCEHGNEHLSSIKCVEFLD